MDVYFSGIPQIGDLYLEHVFYEYGEPILFVCVDKSANRYLCSCSRVSEQWLVGKVTNKQLLCIIDKVTAIDLALRESEEAFCVQWDGKSLHRLDRIPYDAYPKTNSMLRLTKNQTDEYRRAIESMS